jgi:hypothetical protein
MLLRCVVSLALLPLCVLADDPAGRTALRQMRSEEDGFVLPEHLARVRAEFARLGATYLALKDSKTRRVTHIFRMPAETTEDNLKDMPRPAFDFVLDMTHGVQVTDVGLRHLAHLDHLAMLGIKGTSVTGEGFGKLQHLERLRALWIFDASLTEEGLQAIGKLTRLHVLSLSGCRVTAAGLSQLKRCKNLTSLDLDSPTLTDDGLKEISNLDQLTTLRLGFTKVTDKGLEHLTVFKNLRYLDLRCTQVTAAGVRALQRALPQCEIRKSVLEP